MNFILELFQLTFILFSIISIVGFISLLFTCSVWCLCNSTVQKKMMEFRTGNEEVKILSIRSQY